MLRTILVVSLLALPSIAFAQNATTPGAITTPHPTLEHISLEWSIDGDVDLDGQVTVRFREEGASTWREGLPLMRVPAGSNGSFSWANRHAGSLFGLRPDTAYEIELTLTDPDGGSETRTTTARTRPVPTVPDDVRIIEATPGNLGSRLAEALPGDVIVLGPGTYSGFRVERDGEPGRPIVVRGSDVEDVLIDGEVRMDGRSHVWIEDMTVHGQIKLNNATGIVIRGFEIHAMTATGDGIVSYSSGSTDGYFADNTVLGRTTWAEASLGVDGDNIGEGIVMTGPGNVIMHNRVVGFRDCISLQEDGGASRQISIDIIGNDLDTCADDAIEADFAMGNVRVMRNRMTSSFVALSSQPSLGGPTYFIRNVMFNVIFQAFKPNRGSIGDVWLHNTVVKSGDAMGVYAGREWSRAFFRNNLLIGGTGGRAFNGFSNGDGRVLQVADADEATCDFDYDGFGSIGTGTFRGRFGGTSFSSLDELRSNTSEAHAVEVDLSVFAASFTFPEEPFPGHPAPDLRLTEGAAVDVGQPLPNINDGFAGSAPDLGAYELGSALPPYGPRSGLPVCGNGVVEAGETCDDGNTRGGDGCSPSCLLEASDGGVVSPDGGAVSSPDAGSVEMNPEAPDPCGCRAVGRSRSGGVALAMLALVALVRLRRG